MQQQKIESVRNSNDRADQIAGRNNNNMLVIPRANLELKHMFITCLQYGHMLIIHFNSTQ